MDSNRTRLELRRSIVEHREIQISKHGGGGIYSITTTSARQNKMIFRVPRGRIFYRAYC